MKKTVVLAYSGGARSSAAAKWLAEHHDAAIVTVTLDLGQSGELSEIRDRAMADGAARAHVLDVRDAFARDIVLPSLKAGALSDSRYPMATALSRPLIAKALAEIAGIEKAAYVSHGASGSPRGAWRRCAPTPRAPRRRAASDAGPRPVRTPPGPRPGPPRGPR